MKRIAATLMLLAFPGLVVAQSIVDERDRPVITSIAQLQAKTDTAKKALDAAESALVNLEEEARKAGVPPGWLR